MKKQTETIYTEDTITLYLENNQEVECDILAIFPYQERFYIALMPKTSLEGYEEGEYFLYRYASDGDNIELSDIESEEEWEAVEDQFEELLDEEYFHQTE